MYMQLGAAFVGLCE